MIGFRSVFGLLLLCGAHAKGNDYKAYKGKDHLGDDLLAKPYKDPSDIKGMMKTCDSLKNCTCFNSKGFFKSSCSVRESTRHVTLYVVVGAPIPATLAPTSAPTTSAPTTHKSTLAPTSAQTTHAPTAAPTNTTGPKANDCTASVEGHFLNFSTIALESGQAYKVHFQDKNGGAKIVFNFCSDIDDLASEDNCTNDGISAYAYTGGVCTPLAAIDSTPVAKPYSEKGKLVGAQVTFSTAYVNLNNCKFVNGSEIPYSLTIQMPCFNGTGPIEPTEIFHPDDCTYLTVLPNVIGCEMLKSLSPTVATVAPTTTAPTTLSPTAPRSPTVAPTAAPAKDGNTVTTGQIFGIAFGGAIVGGLIVGITLYCRYGRILRSGGGDVSSSAGYRTLQ